MKNVILVAGVNGVSGRAAAEHWSAVTNTDVYGLSRRSAPLAGVIPVSVDLLNPEDVRQKLGRIKDVTHIIFGAYIEKQTAAQKSVVNVAIRSAPLLSKMDHAFLWLIVMEKP